MTEEETLVEFADILQDWHGLDHLGAKEVLAWWDGEEPAIAIRGDALRMTMSAFREGGLNNHDHYLDVSLQRHFGLDPEVKYRGHRVVFVAPQLMTTPYADISEVIEGIKRVAGEYFSEKGFEVYPQVTLMPSEGSPWNYDDDETSYYNAKKRKILKTERPAWLTTVQVYDNSGKKVDAVAADLCKIIDQVEVPGEFVAGAFQKGYDNLVLFTHCINFERVDEIVMADFINECGGFLFPSLAVGPIPAANFGPVCLVFDPYVVIQSQAPYKKRRGRWPVVTYTTDVWSGTMYEFLGEASVEMFEQLTGHAGDFTYYSKRVFWVLGPRIVLDRGPAVAKVVKSTKQLRAQLKRRGRIWKRGLSKKKLEEQLTVLVEDRYPYLEAKLNNIVNPSAITACVYPVDMEEQVSRYLELIQFQGVQVPLDMKYNPYDQEEVYAWSWAVHDAIDGLGKPILEIDVS